MFRGLKKIRRNFKGLYLMFKNASDFGRVADNIGVYGAAYADMRFSESLTGLFYPVLTGVDYAERYFKLIRNLDEQSLQDIADIINGIIAYKSGGLRAKMLKRKMLAIRYEVHENFFDRILKLSNEIYSWKNFSLPGQYFSAACFYYNCGLDYLNDTECLRDKNILDIGGFVGDSALLLSPLARTGKVYIFEAASFALDLLQKTLRLNNIQNAVIEPRAVSDHHGTVMLSGCYNELDGATIFSGLQPSEKDVSEGKAFRQNVELTTIDHYVEQYNISDIGLIKMDIEGAETAALRGARKTIQRDRPALIISIYHNPDDFFGIKPMIESWNLGYEFKIRRCPFFLLEDTVLLAEVPTGKCGQR